MFSSSNIRVSEVEIYVVILIIVYKCIQNASQDCNPKNSPITIKVISEPLLHPNTGNIAQLQTLWVELLRFNSIHQFQD